MDDNKYKLKPAPQYLYAKGTALTRWGMSSRIACKQNDIQPRKNARAKDELSARTPKHSLPPTKTCSTSKSVNTHVFLAVEKTIKCFEAPA